MAEPRGRSGGTNMDTESRGPRLSRWNDPKDSRESESRRRPSGGMDRRGGRMEDATPRRRPRDTLPRQWGSEREDPEALRDKAMLHALGATKAAGATGRGAPSPGRGISWTKPPEDVNYKFHEILRWLQGEDVQNRPGGDRSYGWDKGERRFVPRRLEGPGPNEFQSEILANFDRYFTQQAPEDMEQALSWSRQMDSMRRFKSGMGDKGGIDPQFKRGMPMPMVDPDFHMWMNDLMLRRPDIEAYLQYGIPLKPEDQKVLDDWVDKYTEYKTNPIQA